jgi:hypothetical protein
MQSHDANGPAPREGVMNPDQLLQSIRDAIAAVRKAQGHSFLADATEMLERALDAIEYFESLDIWLCEGGAKPRDWQEAERRIAGKR